MKKEARYRIHGAVSWIAETERRERIAGRDETETKHVYTRIENIKMITPKQYRFPKSFSRYVCVRAEHITYIEIQPFLPTPRHLPTPNCETLAHAHQRGQQAQHRRQFLLRFHSAGLKTAPLTLSTGGARQASRSQRQPTVPPRSQLLLGLCRS